jgi:hypothetical protein
MTTMTLTMSRTELDRLGAITRVRERRLTQFEAARILDPGVWQSNGCARRSRPGWR